MTCGGPTNLACPRFKHLSWVENLSKFGLGAITMKIANKIFEPKSVLVFHSLLIKSINADLLFLEAG